MLKKLLPILAAILFNLNLSAQNSEPRIKPSDPTLLYTQVNVSGGINFIDYSPRYWKFIFGGSWAIKEKFSFGFHAPITNNASGPSIFENLSLNAAYQIHYNTGFFNSSLIAIGLTTPVTDDYYIRFINQQYSASHELRARYTAGLKVSEKISLYPQLEYFRRFGESRVGFMNPNGEIQYEPILKKQGFKTGIMMSYDFNTKNFLQFGATYTRGIWKQESVSEQVYDITGNTLDLLDMRFRYQRAFTPRSQMFMELNQRFGTIIPRNSNWRYTQNLSGLSIGYNYFID